MPSPISALGTLRPDLGGSLEEFNLAADRQGFIAQRVLPVFEVAEAAGPFPRIPIEELLQRRTVERAMGASYARGDWKFEMDSYACTEKGVEEVVDKRMEKLYRNFFDAETVSASRAVDAVLREYEIRVASAVFNPTTWTGSGLTTGVSNEWDNYANATPIADVNAAVRAMWLRSGIWANALVINRHVFRNLRNCDEVKDALHSEGAGDSIVQGRVTERMLAQVFDLDQLIVAGGTQNDAGRGLAADISSNWSDEYAMVCRVATGPDIVEPCIGRTFHWAEDGSAIGTVIESYDSEERRGRVIRARHDTDEKILMSSMGHLLSNITT